MSNSQDLDRWLAYWLGELPEAERPGVESAMAIDPDRAEECRRMANAVRGWANETTPHEPLNIAAITGRTPRPARPQFRRAAWVMAAAALLLAALSQTQFSISFGDARIDWGRTTGAVRELQTELEQTRADLARALETAEESQRQVTAVGELAVLLDAKLRNVGAELSATQQAESLTRYQDVKRLVQLASQNQ